MSKKRKKRKFNDYWGLDNADQRDIREETEEFIESKGSGDYVASVSDDPMAKLNNILGGKAKESDPIANYWEQEESPELDTDEDDEDSEEDSSGPRIHSYTSDQEEDGEEDDTEEDSEPVEDDLGEILRDISDGVDDTEGSSVNFDEYAPIFNGMDVDIKANVVNVTIPQENLRQIKVIPVPTAEVNNRITIDDGVAPVSIPLDKMELSVPMAVEFESDAAYYENLLVGFTYIISTRHPSVVYSIDEFSEKFKDISHVDDRKFMFFESSNREWIYAYYVDNESFMVLEELLYDYAPTRGIEILEAIGYQCIEENCVFFEKAYETTKAYVERYMKEENENAMKAFEILICNDPDTIYFDDEKNTYEGIQIYEYDIFQAKAREAVENTTGIPYFDIDDDEEEDDMEPIEKTPIVPGMEEELAKAADEKKNNTEERVSLKPEKKVDPEIEALKAEINEGLDKKDRIPPEKDDEEVEDVDAEDIDLGEIDEDEEIEEETHGIDKLEASESQPMSIPVIRRG